MCVDQANYVSKWIYSTVSVSRAVGVGSDLTFFHVWNTCSFFSPESPKLKQNHWACHACQCCSKYLLYLPKIPFLLYFHLPLPNADFGTAVILYLSKFISLFFNRVCTDKLPLETWIQVEGVWKHSLLAKCRLQIFYLFSPRPYGSKHVNNLMKTFCPLFYTKKSETPWCWLRNVSLFQDHFWLLWCQLYYPRLSCTFFCSDLCIDLSVTSNIAEIVFLSQRQYFIISPELSLNQKFSYFGQDQFFLERLITISRNRKHLIWNRRIHWISLLYSSTLFHQNLFCCLEVLMILTIVIELSKHRFACLLVPFWFHCL